MSEPTVGQELAVITNPVAMTVTRDQMELAKRTVFPEANNDEFAMFLHECQRKNVHPLDRMIHPQKRNGKVVFVSSIDWFRSKAEGSGELAGNDDPIPTYNDKGALTSCSVTVWRIVKGVRCPFTATARWAEYYPGEKQGFMWAKMPVLMLGKCAESLALRKAFPSLLAGSYTHDEMEQAGSGDGGGTLRSADSQPSAASTIPARPVTALPAPAHVASETYQMPKPETSREDTAKLKAAKAYVEKAMAPAPVEQSSPYAGHKDWPAYHVFWIGQPKAAGKGTKVGVGLDTERSVKGQKSTTGFFADIWTTDDGAGERMEIIEHAKKSGDKIHVLVAKTESKTGGKPFFNITEVEHCVSPESQSPAQGELPNDPEPPADTEPMF